MTLWDNARFLQLFVLNTIPVAIRVLKLFFFSIVHRITGIDPAAGQAYPSIASLPDVREKKGKPCPYVRNYQRDLHPYIAPVSTDHRSPCPALNTMANHGYLPRNGQGLNGTVLTRALMACYNLSWPLAAFLSWGGVLLLDQVGLFSLRDLSRHNRIEHDASLAHANSLPGDEYAPTTVHRELYDAFLEDARSAHFTAYDIARARVRREKDPGTRVTAVQQEIARGEVALVLSVFGGERFAVPVDVVHSWWRDEKLPEGWGPTRQTTLHGTIHWSSVIRSAMTTLRKREPQTAVVEEVVQEKIVSPADELRYAPVKWNPALAPTTA